MIDSVRNFYIFLITAFLTCNMYADKITFEVHILNKELSIVPTFNPIEPICFGSEVASLPTISLNGITGTWSPATIDNTVTTVYTFTPNPGQDAVTTSLIVEIIPISTTTIFCELILPTVLQIDWAPIVGSTNQYNFSYSIDGGEPISGTAFTSNYSIPNFLPGQSIVFTLTNAAGVSCFQPVSTTCNSLNNLDFVDITFDYSPNPVNDILNINSRNTIIQIEIINALGQRVFSESFQKKSIHINMVDFKSGLYIVKTYSDKGKNAFKVLKN